MNATARRILTVIIAGGAGAVWTGTASAHSGTGLAGGFLPGFMHPLTGFDHLLAMVCVGLWGAFLGAPLLQTLPVIFPAMMVGGAALGMFAVPVPPIEPGIAASVMVLGACIALACKAPVWVASSIVAIFAVFHGYAHGRELPSAASPITYSAGFVLATGLLHLAGIAIGCLTEWPAGRAVVRGMGGAVSLVGAWLLCQVLLS
jgi:urease accessory protein